LVVVNERTMTVAKIIKVSLTKYYQVQSGLTDKQKKMEGPPPSIAASQLASKRPARHTSTGQR
jgi:hypothetical protein